MNDEFFIYLYLFYSNCKGVFLKEELPLVRESILSFLAFSPMARLNDVRDHLQKAFNRLHSSTGTQRLMNDLGWSWRVPTKFQLHKYSASNMAYYCTYLQAIQAIPLEKLKFVDESHIISRDLTSRYDHFYSLFSFYIFSFFSSLIFKDCPWD